MMAYRDKHGVPFGGYRNLLPARPADWPAVERVSSSLVLRDFHYTWDHCQVCGRRPDGTIERVLEAHHIIGGYLRGRSDERTNLIMLCRQHHEQANTAALPLGLILWCKWRTDRRNMNWVRLALLRRQHLPDLIVDTEFARTYERNRAARRAWR